MINPDEITSQNNLQQGLNVKPEVLPTKFPEAPKVEIPALKTEKYDPLTQQFLKDPAAQDAVVNGRFKDMLADQAAAGFSGEQMIRRAAAVWYSGQARLWNDTKPQYSNGRQYPSIAEYTKAIWQSYLGK